MQLSFARSVALCAAALALAACGGGSSDSGTNNSTPTITPPSPPSAQSLVPSPSSLGATLASSALSLWPLNEAYSWRYRGRDYSVPSAGNAYIAYDNTVTLRASNVGGPFVQGETNSGNEGAVNGRVGIAGNSVYDVLRIEIDGVLVANELQSTFLRSPVKVNDQYTLLERFGIQLKNDYDGDLKKDTADVAVYRIVRDWESVQTPARQFDAVRIDTIFRSRLHLSSGQPASEALITESTWFAPGIGPVRRTLSIASSPRTTEIEEALSDFDGKTSGIGTLAPTQLRIPTGYDRAGEAITRIQHAVAMDDGALLLGASAPTVSLGFRLTKLNPRGELVHTREYRSMPMSPAAMVSFGDEAIVVAAMPDRTIGLARFDARGNSIGGETPSISLPIASAGTVTAGWPSAIRAANVGGELWVTWIRAVSLPGTNSYYIPQLVVRPFTKDGVPLAEESIIENAYMGTLDTRAMSSTSDSALLPFRKSNPPYTDDWALLRRSGGPITIARGRFQNYFAVPTALSVGGQLGLAMRGSYTGGSSRLVGFAIDQNAQPIRAGQGDDLSTEDLPGSLFDSYSAMVSDGRVAYFASGHLGRLRPETSADLVQLTVAEFVPGAGPWANSGVMSKAITTSRADWIMPTPNGGNLLLLPLNDTLLVVNTFSGEYPIAVLPIWRSSFQ